MNDRTITCCINFLKARGVDCYQQGEEVSVFTNDLELILSQDEVTYRAELWLESELQGVKEGIL